MTLLCNYKIPLLPSLCSVRFTEYSGSTWNKIRSRFVQMTDDQSCCVYIRGAAHAWVFIYAAKKQWMSFRCSSCDVHKALPIIQRKLTHAAVLRTAIQDVYALCLAAERLKMDIPQQAAGWKANQLPEQNSKGYDWLLGIPVVMMMGIRSCLCGLYPGAEVH